MSNQKEFIPTLGYCIHCNQTIKFNLAAQFCIECESLLREVINIYEQENFCLKCNKENKNKDISFNKPICNTCTAIQEAEYLSNHSKFLSN